LILVSRYDGVVDIGVVDGKLDPSQRSGRPRRREYRAMEMGEQECVDG
jgi:hypothetical protein